MLNDEILKKYKKIVVNFSYIDKKMYFLQKNLQRSRRSLTYPKKCDIITVYDYVKARILKDMNDIKNVRLLIFDLDGTLADTMCGIMDGVNMAMDRFGAPRHTYEEVCSYVGTGSRDLVRRALPAELSEDESFVDEAVKYYDSSCYPVTYKNGTKCYDGMIDALKTLKERGYTLAVLSNKRDIFVRPMVAEMIPEGLMSVAMGQRDELPKKPDPTVPRMIAESLGFAPSETAFIGDSDTDIETGKNAEMLTVGCVWGYRGREVLQRAGADLLIDAPRDLTNLFLAF